jgi:hypothetical protein
MIHIRGRELVGLYLMLKREDSYLDETLSSLLDRIEAYLYQNLSIDQMEELEDLYEKKIDVLQ